MKLYMYGYKRGCYENNKVLILASDANEAFEKARRYMKKLTDDNNYGCRYELNHSYGEVDVIDFQYGFEDSVYLNGRNSVNF